MEGSAFFEKVEKIKMPVRLLILFGTLIVILGAFAWFIYLPKTEEINKTNQNISNLDAQLARAKIERKKLPKLQAEKKLVESQFQEALKLLPNTKEIPSLLKKITELGTNSSLDFRIFRPKKEVTKEFYIEIPLAIEVRGTYHNVAIFFDKVGHMERIMNIHNVTMKPIKAGSTDLIVTCDAITYRFKGE